MNNQLLTLVLVTDQGKILLGMKKRGFGAGLWNGFGGKVLEGENIETAAKREVQEECGIVANELVKRGIIHFSFEGQEQILEVHLFEAKEHSGQPVETEEMRPQWFSYDEIPYDQMWPDDKIWLPLYLVGANITATFAFDQHKNVISYNINKN